MLSPTAKFIIIISYIEYVQGFGMNYIQACNNGLASIKKEFRKHQYGYKLVANSIQFIEKKLQENNILISAQSYLSKFYNSLGFIKIGEEYLEDGIPHIKMLRN